MTTKRPPLADLQAKREELKTMKAMAAHYGVAVSTISRWMAEYGMTTRQTI